MAPSGSERVVEVMVESMTDVQAKLQIMNDVLNVMDWGVLRKKGFKVSVLKNIEIAAITVNPWSPQGYSFESEALVGAMKEVLTGIPIIDVRK